MRYSVIVPAYNEADSVEPLHAELTTAMRQLGSYELVFVDDGSDDGTGDRLEALAKSDGHLRLVRFVRNFGKSAAYTAGFEMARGDIVVTLDADLQDDPAEIPELLRGLEHDNDLVVGWKQGRLGNEPTKTVPSRLFNWMIRVLFGLRLHDSNCGFRAMHRRVLSALELHGDLYRFIPELAHVKGFRVAEVPVQHRRRQFGRSKYGVLRFWTGLLDLLSARYITAFTQKPLHFFGTLGLLPLLIGAGIEVYVLVRRAIGDTFREHMAAIIVGVMLVLVGLQLVATGLIGEMLAAQRQRRGYIVRDREGGEEPRQ